MKKLLLAAVLAGLASVTTAQTRVYGLADAYLGQTTGKQSTTQVSSGGMSTSHFGITATENIGNGMKASAVLETFWRPDTGVPGRFNGDAFWARNAYVALSSKAGEMQVGRITSPYFISTIAFNAFGDSSVFSPIFSQRYGVNNYNLAAGGADSGWNNSVLVKANMQGLNLTGVYSPGIVDDATGTKQAARSVGGMYFNGPVGLTATWQDVDTGAGRPSMTSTIVGGSYDLKVAKFFAQWDRVNHSDTVTKEDRGYTVGASMKLPNTPNTIMASYAKYDHTFADHRSAETATWAVGLSHALSKRTDVYAAVRDTNYTNDGVNRTNVAWADTRVTGLGVRHRF